MLSGSSAVGQRESVWINQESGGVTFPQGFPDTLAAREFSILQVQEDEAERKKRPKGRYRKPWESDWIHEKSGNLLL